MSANVLVSVTMLEDQAFAAVGSGEEDVILPRVRDALISRQEDARLWQAYALLLRSLNEMQRSVEAFHTAARLAPSDGLIAHGLAHASYEAGLPALSLFERALKLSPGSREVRQGMIAAAVQEAGVDDGIDRLDSFLSSDKRWLDGYWLLAKLHWANGHHEEATRRLRRAIMEAPGDSDLHRQLIFILMNGECHEEALVAIGALQSVIGEAVSLNILAASCLSEGGDPASAEPLFAAADPAPDIGLALRIVRHYLRCGQPERALASAAPFARSNDAHMIVPYVSLAWRLMNNPAWQRLEGQPGLVGIYDIAEDLPELTALAEKLRALHIAKSQPIAQSVRGGTQTDGPLLSHVDPMLVRMREGIERAVRRHIDALPPRDLAHPTLSYRRDRSVRFSGSWSVRLKGQGHHSNHVHPGGWFSSALYIALPERKERGGDQAGWLSFGQPQKQLGLDLPPTCLVEPRPGRLVLFPSTMWHGTIPFEAGERLTVAFDVARPR